VELSNFSDGWLLLGLVCLLGLCMLLFRLIAPRR
jgi:hypothetical protein